MIGATVLAAAASALAGGPVPDLAGFGGGAVLQANLAEMLFARGLDVLTIFRYIGIAYGLVVVISALLLSFPEEKPADPDAAPAPAARLEHSRTSRALPTPFP